MRNIDLSKYRELSLLLTILAVTLVLRLSVSLYIQSFKPSRAFTSDSFSYLNSVRALLQLGKFAVSPEEPKKPQTMRTPGYPAFIALIYMIFGEKNLPVILIQILISLGTIAITYFIARKLWNSRVALASVALLSLDVNSFLYSQMLLTETLFTFLLVAAIAFGVWLILGKEGWKRYALLLGTFIALATLVRPVSYYLIFFIFIGFLIFGKIARWD